ncbi:DUF3999 domain-containing protein [Pluralibacter gergoviae]|uniref:DUF3999 family protein n=1 Tax=Pluralibacter gergoviae TaxID=61647 RepID=UPI0028815554|nr:DUF3999 domain-containing protein [Pluralibacter gergoviae]ELK5594979.1 DUF3999 domain-containing protein [Pluralibacter gergoviae]MDU4436019.1 DUF3999 family protein [Pluralibacter gergoviae]
MKGIKALLLGLVSLTGPALGEAPQPESAQDYAYGSTLDTAQNSPWYRVTLPRTLYQQTASADLRDVRVFNREGEAVPFTLTTQKQQPEKAAAPVALRIFPLAVSPVSTDEDRRSEGVMLRGKNGFEIQFSAWGAKTPGASYLLALPEDRQGAVRLSQLRLDWKPPQEGWQGSVSLWAIRAPGSGEGWQPLKENVPLMELASGGDRLKLDTVDLQVLMSAEETRYLLLVFRDKGPQLTAASAIAPQTPAWTASVAVPGQAGQHSAREAIWRWRQPQPLKALQVSLSGEGTLPLVMEWRPAADAAWQPLAKTVAYRLDDETSPPLTLSGSLVEAVRLMPVSGRFPDALPAVSGLRDGYQLIFNAQGKGPYILAWGNGAARPASLPLDELIPESLRQSHDIDALPEAAPVAPVTLGGEARLGATSEEAQRSRWQTLLVWAILITGVLALAGMAWRLWREAKSGASSH